MKDYWLAKLISSVKRVDCRKRLQKSVYLLQRKGCPLKCDYFLHYYGPYSTELAGLIDRLDGAGLIRETSQTDSYGNVTYSSAITAKGKRVLASFEKTPDGRKALGAIHPFVADFRKLTDRMVGLLELSATVAFLYDQSWPDAGKRAAAFKKVKADSKEILNAVNLAKEFVERKQARRGRQHGPKAVS